MTLNIKIPRKTIQVGKKMQLGESRTISADVQFNKNKSSITKDNIDAKTFILYSDIELRC